MAYNTGNPIGSADPRDLYDNAENLDEAINGTASTWVDRLGVTRKTFKAAENAADAAEAAANNAIDNEIPTQVNRVQTDANTAISTEIPAQVSSVESTANTAINSLIPIQVSRVEDSADTAVDNVDAIAGQARRALYAAEADWESRFLVSQQGRADEFSQEQIERDFEFQQQLIQNGYQELGEYAAGIVIENLNQVVTVGNYLYRLSPAVPRPYTTSGDWQADSGDFVQIDFVTASQLAQEKIERQSSDANLQNQIVGNSPFAAAERPIVQWHAKTIEASLTVPDNVNAFSAGPEINLAAGVFLTIGNNSFYTVMNGSVTNA